MITVEGCRIVFLTVSKMLGIRWLGARPVKMERRSLTALPKMLVGSGLSPGTGVTWFGLWAARMARVRSAVDIGWVPPSRRAESIW